MDTFKWCIYLGGTWATLVYAFPWGWGWALALAVVWPWWLTYRGLLMLLRWLAL